MDAQQTAAADLPVDSAILTRVVRAALGSERAVVERWQAQPAGASRGSATTGVFRLSGAAFERGALLEWAVMLKVIRPGAAAFNPAAREVDHPLYWKREALAYQSGLLDNLPGGITAPRCYAVEERDDESCWLWLEEVQDRDAVRWPLAQYRRAASALGRFNGAYLAGRPIPSYLWLGAPGALRGALHAFAYVYDVVRDETTWQHPLLRSAFPASIADRLLNLWEGCAPLLDALDRLPKTLCHKDAFRRNMFALPDAAGQPRLALIDWAYVGLGEIGLDVADLFGASYSTFGVEPTDLWSLDAAIFESYLAGLCEAGWRGDSRLARFGFAASASLKYAGLLLWLSDLADARRSAAWEALSGQPIDRFVQHQAALVYYLLSLLDEAHELLRFL
jgi:hypothetical protein